VDNGAERKRAALVDVDVNTSSTTGRGAVLDDWSMGELRVRERARPAYAHPEDVFESEYDRLVRALTIIAGEREVAADAVQEAFVRLVRRWGRLSSYEDPAGWVRRVALNQIRDHQRSLWRQGRLLLRIQQQSSAAQGALATDEELWEQLRTLPLKQRTALALHYVGDLTARETAEVMRISEGAVDQHLHRARRTLKEALGGLGDE
jgi:RNA polymerase sigma-70 factor (ECF subfamily)